MRVVSISGTRGSGKTTLIRKLVSVLSAMGRSAGIIVNEVGEEDYTPDFTSTYGIRLAKLRGG